MHRRKDNSAMLLTVITAVSAVIGMIFQSMAVLYGYDAAMRVFKQGSGEGTTAVALLFVLSALLAAAAVIFAKRGEVSYELPEGNIVPSLSAVGGAAVTISGILLLISEIFSSKLPISVLLSRPYEIMTVLLFAVSLPAGMSLILSGFGGGKVNSFSKALSFFPPIWAAIGLLRIYFDTAAAINDPVRVLLQISLVAVMLALLFDLKLSVKGTGFVSFSVAASLSGLLGACASLSVFILYFATKSVTAAVMFLSLAELILCMYLVARLNARFKR